LVVVVAFALGEDAGGAPSTAPGPGHVEGENEEGDQAPAPAPPPPVPPKGQGYVRHAPVLEDGMVRVPASKFTMGSSEKSAPANERPARVIGVPTFWTDRTEVTVGAYRACVERGKCERPARSSTMCTYE